MPVALVLAAPEALVAALTAVVIAFGVYLLVLLVSKLMPGASLPVVGSLERAVLNAGSYVLGKIEQAVDAAATPFAAFIGFLIGVVKYPVQAAQHLAGTIYNNLAIMTLHWIPGIYSYLVSSVENAYGKALAFARAIGAEAAAALSAAVVGLQTWVHGVYAYLVAGIEQAYAKATAYTARVERWADARITAAQAAAAAALAATAAALRGELAAAYAKATAYAAGVAEHWGRQAVATVDAEAAAAAGAVWQGIVTDVQGLVDAAGDGFADVRDAVGAIPRAVPADLAGALAGVATLSVPLLRLAKDCTIPQCRNLGGLSRLFEDLFSAGTDAALVAMLAELVHDPEGAATTIRRTLGPLATETTDLAKRLVGV